MGYRIFFALKNLLIYNFTTFQINIEYENF